MNFDPTIVAQYGLLGVVLVWFMFRFEKKLDVHTATITDLTKTLLLEVLSRESVTEHIKTQANEILTRVSARSAKAATFKD